MNISYFIYLFIALSHSYGLCLWQRKMMSRSSTFANRLKQPISSAFIYAHACMMMVELFNTRNAVTQFFFFLSRFLRCDCQKEKKNNKKIRHFAMM